MTSKEFGYGLPRLAIRDMGTPTRVKRHGGDSYLLSYHLRAYELLIQASSPRLQESIEVRASEHL